MATIPYDSPPIKDPEVRDALNFINKERRQKRNLVIGGLVALVVVMLAFTGLMYTYTPSDIGSERIGNMHLE